MEVTILKEFENKTLERKELDIEISYEKVPPKRTDILESISSRLKIEKDLIVLQRMNNIFGQRKLRGRINVYKNAEQINRCEPAYFIKRVKGKEEEKK